VRSDEERSLQKHYTAYLHSRPQFVASLLAPLFASLIAEGKRIKGTVKSRVDKFLWTKGKDIWGAFSCQVGIPAEKLFAYLFEDNTYHNYKEHVKANGNLPIASRTNVDGSRSLQQSIGFYFPSPLQHRIFHNWISWRQVNRNDGKKRFEIGIVPLNQYQGAKKSIVK